VLLEGFGKLKEKYDDLIGNGIEPTTFRLAAQCLNHPR
jgi:hypothetical protein